MQSKPVCHQASHSHSNTIPACYRTCRRPPLHSPNCPPKCSRRSSRHRGIINKRANNKHVPGGQQAVVNFIVDDIIAASGHAASAPLRVVSGVTCSGSSSSRFALCSSYTAEVPWPKSEFASIDVSMAGTKLNCRDSGRLGTEVVRIHSE